MPSRLEPADLSVRRALIFVIAASALGLPHVSAPAFAHGGGLNADGCHTNRKTGEYHCHGAGGGGGSKKKAKGKRGGKKKKGGGRSSFYSGGGGSTHYANCDAARSAGAAPVRSGDPGYRRGLDRDGDGVGCE